jgi:hypothetical protein
MKNNIIFIISILFFLICLSIYCNFVKPMPEGRGWILCPKCKGYGKIAYVDSNSSWFGRNHEKEEHDKAIRDLSDSSEAVKRLDEDNMKSGSTSSSRTKYMKCLICEGTGWVTHRILEQKGYPHQY